MIDRLPPGKVPWDLVADLVAGELPPEVRLGPAAGEDAALVELGGIDAIVFDMDGTLVDSSYDWPAIRRRLEVTGPSIIDALNELPEKIQRERWAELEKIEAEASRAAELHPGVIELRALLTDRGIATALVTNNNDANTRNLLERFGLEFDTVITRDSGMWKPSGAPMAEAARRLDVPPERCLGVGDSHFDILAARNAGCGKICILHDTQGRHDTEADLSFQDIPAFVQYLRIVL